jgi:SAM-dependent methyltransferase
MSANPTATDWLTTRGERWASHVDGLEATLAPVDAAIVGALQLDGATRIAEVGAGGGGTAQRVRRHAPASATVDAFDLVPNLVALAARRSADTPGLHFHVADAATHVPPVRYDRLYSRFGVMFFDAPEAAFANLAAWLAPGGRAVFAVWASPDENPWITVAREVVASVVPPPTSEPDAPGPYRYADATRLAALLERVGLRQVEPRTWRGTLPVGGGVGPVEAARFALGALSNFGEQLAAAGPEAAATALRRLIPRYAAALDHGQVRLGAAVHVVTASRTG